MPTYDYECKQCGNTFEVFQSISAPPEKVCPKCHGEVRRLIGTGAGIIFKGSGFYATDYRSNSYKSGAKAEHCTATPKSDKKPESKAAAPAAAATTTS